MFRLIFFILILLSITIAVSWLYDNDGTVSLYWFNYYIETKISFIIVSLSIAFFLIIMLLEVLFIIINSPLRFFKYRAYQSETKGWQALAIGITAALAGDSRESIYQQKKALRLLPQNQPFMLFLQSENARLEGKTHEAGQYLKQMLSFEESKFLALKYLFNDAMKEHRYEEANNYAERAYQLKPEATWTKPALLETYERTKRWAESELLLRKESKSLFNLMKPDSENNRKKGLAMFMRARHHDSLGDKEKALEIMKEASKYLADFAPAQALYAILLYQTGNLSRAMTVIQKSWKISPHPEVAAAFMSMKHNDMLMKRIKKLTSYHQNHVESLKLLAYGALESNSYDEANSYIDEALKTHQTTSIFKLKAAINDLLGDKKSKIEWENRANISDNDSVWRCEICNHKQVSWDLICPKCQSIDKFMWIEASYMKLIN